MFVAKDAKEDELRHRRTATKWRGESIRIRYRKPNGVYSFPFPYVTPLTIRDDPERSPSRREIQCKTELVTPQSTNGARCVESGG